MKINESVLTEALREHTEDKMAKEFREWVVFSAPEDVRSVLQRYEQKMLERQDAFISSQKF